MDKEKGVEVGGRGPMEEGGMEKIKGGKANTCCDWGDVKGLDDLNKVVITSSKKSYKCRFSLNLWI
jgi:hypothetical protein